MASLEKILGSKTQILRLHFKAKQIAKISTTKDINDTFQAI